MNETILTAAAVQLSSQEDVDKNMERVRALVTEARRAGATLVTLPENFALMGEEEDKRAIAEPLDGALGPIGKELSRLAKELEIAIVAGGFPERTSDPRRPYNTSVLFDRTGALASRYRKIHLFDVDVPGGQTYRESHSTTEGEEPVVARVAGVDVGMTVCYDVRFPELYRILAVRGATVLSVPSAFTFETGKDHWEVLLRARAIESQAFVIAPNQVGEAPPQYDSYGHSMLVDPWGTVLAVAPDGECFVAADLDLSEEDRVRSTLPSLANRRPGAYRWPEEAHLEVPSHA